MEGEDEEHRVDVEMGQSDGDVLTCTACYLKQQGQGSGLLGGGVALQSPVMTAGRASDCQPAGQYSWHWGEWRPCVDQDEGRQTWL